MHHASYLPLDAARPSPRWTLPALGLFFLVLAFPAKAQGTTPADEGEGVTLDDDATRAHPTPERDAALPLQVTEVEVLGGPRARVPHVGPPRLGLAPHHRSERAGASWDALLGDNAGIRTRSLGPAPERPVIRGFDGERILVLEDGQRMGDVSGSAEDHAISVDPLSVVEVEVIRGPIGVLYGGNAIGGVVDLRRASLLDAWPAGMAATARSTVSSVDRGAGLHVGGAFGGEHLALGLRLSGRTSGAVRTPDGPLNDTQSLAGEVGADLGWRSEELRGELRVAWRQHTYGLPDGDDVDATLEDAAGERVEMRLRRLRLSHELGWEPQGGSLRLRHVAAFTAYVHDESEIESVAGEAAIEDVELQFDIMSHSQRLELHVVGQAGVRGEGRFGIDVDFQRSRIAGEEVLTPDATRSRAGLFGVQELVLSPTAHLIAGLRGELTHISTSSNEAFSRDQGNLPAGDIVFPDIAASLGFRVVPTPGLTLGLQGARAFRAPLVEELYSDAPHLGANAYEVGDPTLGSEVAHGADAWVRWTQGVLALDASLFVSHITGYIVRAPTDDFDPSSGLRVFAYGSTAATLLGGELSADLELPANVAVRVALDVVRGSEGGIGGSPLPAMPPPRLVAHLGWSPGVHFVRLRSTWTSAQRRVAANEETTEGHALFGATLGTRFGSLGGYFTAVLQLDNVMNTAWRDHLSRVERRDRPMPGRNILLALTGEW